VATVDAPSAAKIAQVSLWLVFKVVSLQKFVLSAKTTPMQTRGGKVKFVLMNPVWAVLSVSGSPTPKLKSK
jgi:hypothetical protein